MKFTLVLLLIATTLFAQPTITITGPPGNIKAGQTFNLTVSISGTTTPPIQSEQGVQFSFTGMTWPIVATVGSAATTSGKTLTCAQVSTTYNCMVSGANGNLLSDGPLATLAVTLPKTVGSGTTSVALTQVLAASTDSSGTAFSAPITVGSPFALSTTSLCDLNADGKVDALDFSSAVQQAIGVTTCSTADINSDGKCNVLDVITIAIATQSGFCAAK